MQDICMSEHLGIVTSDTSTTGFNFFLTPLNDRISVSKNDYVLIEHPVLGESCPVLAVVKEIGNFETAAVPDFGKKSVMLVAECDIIGYVDGSGTETKVLKRLLFPPNPVSKVFLPNSGFLEDVFSRDLMGRVFRNRVCLGYLETSASLEKGSRRNLRFFLNDCNFVRQHFLVSGVSGVGKTHVASVIVEELANKTPIPVVVLDSYGEYCGVAVKGKGFRKLIKDVGVSGKKYPFDFRFSVYSPNPERVSSQLHVLGAKVEQKGRFFVKSVSSDWLGSGNKSVGSIGVDLGRSLGSGSVTVFDADGLSLEEKQDFFENSVLSLLESRVKGLVKPFVLVVEDAEVVDYYVLRRLMTEGKKLGISVCLLTSNPSALADGVLSQMGTQILGRTTGWDDLKCLRNMALKKVSYLPRLGIGEFILNGITLRKPTKVLIRERYSAKTSAHY